MVLGANTYTSNAPFLTAGFDRSLFDGWITRMFDSPVTVLSSRLTEPLDWPDTTIESDDPVEVVKRNHWRDIAWHHAITRQEYAEAHGMT